MPPKRKKKGKKRWITVAVATFLAVATIFLSLSYIEKFFQEVADRTAKVMGFCVDDINIIGASQKVINEIRSNLRISKNNNIFKLSAKDIYDDVMKSKWVKSAVVRKNLPNTITIAVIETVPIAIFQHDSISELIDNEGACIEQVTVNPGKLPIISGEKANKNVKKILDIIMRYEIIVKKLEALILVRERRWDLYVSGIKVKLPEQDVEHAIDLLATILKNEKINQKTTKIIDLRVPDNVEISGLKAKGKQRVVDNSI
ncbi:MAG: cell division protein FtsQ/DivIB [Holosporales bacterium]|jgi:cell division protein FtsQ|nr:cell division protein FtsQ/DivIB [Holosporales bacterium]